MKVNMKLLLDNRSWIIELIHSIFNHTPVIILREGQTRLTKKNLFCLFVRGLSGKKYHNTG